LQKEKKQKETTPSLNPSSSNAEEKKQKSPSPKSSPYFEREEDQ